METLGQLARAEAECRRCLLYRDATQVVPGKGRVGATLMLVGEQPGDREDLAGEPFVGPAGRVLDEALAAAGIDRRDAFVTNAVKHFKHQRLGKRRLHKRPNAEEIEICRWWLDLERAIVRPAIVVAMGATAARSLIGRPVTLAKLRGRPQALPDGTALMVTIHPSLLLRLANDPPRRQKEHGRFVADLRAAAAAARHPEEPAAAVSA